MTAAVLDPETIIAEQRGRIAVIDGMLKAGEVGPEARRGLQQSRRDAERIIRDAQRQAT